MSLDTPSLNATTITKLVYFLGYDTVAPNPQSQYDQAIAITQNHGINLNTILEGAQFYGGLSEVDYAIRHVPKALSGGGNDAATLCEELQKAGHTCSLPVVAELRAYLGEDLVKEYANCIDLVNSTIQDISILLGLERSIVLQAIGKLGSVETVEEIAEEHGVIAFQKGTIDHVLGLYADPTNGPVTKNILTYGGLPKMVVDAQKLSQQQESEVTITEIYQQRVLPNTQPL